MPGSRYVSIERLLDDVWRVMREYGDRRHGKGARAVAVYERYGQYPVALICERLDQSWTEVCRLAQVFHTPAASVIQTPRPGKGAVRLSCLKCEHLFWSQDRCANRICGDCKGTDVWCHGNDDRYYNMLARTDNEGGTG